MNLLKIYYFIIGYKINLKNTYMKIYYIKK